MKKLKYIILIIIITASCRNKIQKEKTTKKLNISIKDSTLLRKKALSKYVFDSIPLGIKEIVNDEFNKDRNLYITNSNGDLEFDSKFFLPTKKPIEISKYFNNFYKPSLNSSIITDKYPLYDDKSYINKIGVKSSNVEYVLPKIENYFLVIFYVYFNYDKEFDALIDSSRYLVLYDENLEVINELNLDFFHETEESNFIKFFYIDKDYNIYFRYFKNEGEQSEFSKLIKYRVTREGKIIKTN